MSGDNKDKEEQKDDSAQEIEQMKAEVAKLQAEREALAAELESKNEPPRPQPGIINDQQKAALEQKYGMDYDTLEKQSLFMQDLIQPIQAENALLKAEIAADRNYSQNKKQLAAKDPQFSKYEAYVDEYMSDVSLEDKADDKKFKKHMEKAVKYAKGAARGESTEQRDVPEPSHKTETDDFDPTQDDDEKYYGVHTNKKQTFRLQVDKRVEDAYRKKHTSNDVGPNGGRLGLRINDADEWTEASKEINRGGPVHQ